jgi:hypothetical protein
MADTDPPPFEWRAFGTALGCSIFVPLIVLALLSTYVYVIFGRSVLGSLIMLITAVIWTLWLLTLVLIIRLTVK